MSVCPAARVSVRLVGNLRAVVTAYSGADLVPGDASGCKGAGEGEGRWSMQMRVQGWRPGCGRCWARCEGAAGAPPVGLGSRVDAGADPQAGKEHALRETARFLSEEPALVHQRVDTMCVCWGVSMRS
jgi:hypothetical protein